MNKYYVNNTIIKGSYILYYDESRDVGYVESVSECKQPELQPDFCSGLTASIGVHRRYILDALISAWYSKHVSCEFTKQEFIDFCNSIDIPSVPENSIGVKSCTFGFEKGAAYMSILFDASVGDLTERLDECDYEGDVFEIVFPMWSALFKQAPKVLEIEQVGPPHGLPEIRQNLHVAHYTMIQI